MDFEHVLLPCWFWLECVSSWSDDFSTSGILLTSACGAIDCCCWMSSEYIRVLFKSKNIFCECDWGYRYWKLYNYSSTDSSHYNQNVLQMFDNFDYNQFDIDNHDTNYWYYYDNCNNDSIGCYRS